jgi:hypothetical protein
MAGTTREWERPALVVLVRGKPEETVLAACKGAIVQGGPAAPGASCSVKGLACNLKTLS